MFCTNCGRELEKEWKTCPYCGYKVAEQLYEANKNTGEKSGQTAAPEDPENSVIKQYHFEGVRRTARFTFKRYLTDVEVKGNQIHIVSHEKKTKEEEFSKQDIDKISLPLLPVMGVVDKIRIVLFLLLMLCSYGLSVFAVLFFVKITIVRHIKIELKDGRKIKIPIRQKADAADFLRELDYPENEIKEFERKALSGKTLSIREWIVSTIMILVAAVTLVAGMELFVENMEKETVEVSDGKKTDSNVVKSMEEVGGYEAWAASGYEGTVRTDIVVDLPVVDREEENYCVHIMTGLGDPIFIKQENGIPASEWEWLNHAVPNVEGGDTASFQATLTLCGYIKMEERVIPEFIAEDIESYSIEESDVQEEDTSAEADSSQYIFPNSDRAYLSEDEIRSKTTEEMFIGRNEIFARHGYIFENEELRDYFANTSWYKGTVKSDQFNADTVLNDFEKKNVELIKQIEDTVNGVGAASEPFIGISGTYQCGSAPESGVIDVYVVDDNTINIAIGTHSQPGILGGTGGGMPGNIVSANTAVIDWGSCIFTLTWTDTGIFTITREGSSGIQEVDVITNGVEYVEASYYHVS